MAEVVSDSEPSPLEVLRTGLNMVVVLALSDATSGTGIPPGKKGHNKHFNIIKVTDRPAFKIIIQRDDLPTSLNR